ncbi:hypothetical protein FPV67DRAFT_1721296 [Lyophyllum atratum]|nr:hypothetical protein FPV67DRAFT_1721296 [Lyophyllum atratum]
MAAPATSSHNPFRSPAATPNPTGASTPASSSSAPPTAHQNDPAAPHDAHSVEPTGLDEELPPAYTPSPDVHHGESTVEQGPRRPFQPAPPHPPAQPHPTQWQPPPQVPAIHVTQPPLPFHNNTQGRPSLLQQLVDTVTTQLTGSGGGYGRPGVSPQQTGSSASWYGYPGQQQHLQPGAGPSTPHPHSLGAPPLPPRRASSNPASPSSPSSPASPVSPTSPASPASPSSDFARDFYAAGTGDSNPQPNADSSGYAPPPGPPPPTSGQAPSSPRPRPSPTSPSDDGRPTKSPTPGRPLLKDGKLLVYPKGFTCPKCHNIGFKHADPSHPCKKCWSKYGKPFSGPLAYSFSSPSSTSTATTTFQRPLPAFRAPRPPAPHSPPRPPPPPPQHPQQHYVPSPPPLPHHHQPQFHPSPYPHTPPHPHPPPPPQFRTLSPYTPPPPNAIVYPAGDPRLGGRLCWNCGGRGSVSVFIFDAGGCEVCAGLGRVFG